MGNFRDLTGQKFGRWTAIVVVSRKDKKGKSRIVWHCVCDCGNESDVIAHGLTGGTSTSCGCYNHERVSAKRIENPRSYTKLYGVWTTMKSRCQNPNNKSYYRYGGAGITLCEKWQTSEGFYEDMESSYKEGLTIDRINNDLGYSKENCRWATILMQANNKHNNNIINYKGEIDTIPNICRKYNANYKQVDNRIRSGWNIAEAIETAKPH